MRRVVVACLVLGCLVPCALLVGQQILLRVNPARVSDFRAMWYYVWPTAVFLMAAAGPTSAGVLLILGVAVASNMAVYCIGGAIGVLCWRLVCRPAD